MNYLFVLLLVVGLFSQVIAEWQTISTTKELNPAGGHSLDFSSQATEIQCKVYCSRSCNVYLLDAKNLKLLKAGSTSFSTFRQTLGTTYSDYSYTVRGDKKWNIFANIVQWQNVQPQETDVIKILLIVFFVMILIFILFIALIVICVFMIALVLAPCAVCMICFDGLDLGGDMDLFRIFDLCLD
eukprot:gene9855-2178_t